MFHVKQDPFIAALAEAARDLPIPIANETMARMLEHWSLVKAWNQRVNLTAITDDVEAAWSHYRDSLEALRFLPPGKILDIGSGAGYPGIPLAIASAERELVLLEPRRKRASFLEVVAGRLQLTNVRVINGSSTLPPDQLYDAAVTRATFSDPNDLVACLAWVRPGGTLIAFRSAPSSAEKIETHAYRLHDTDRVLEIHPRSL